MSEELRPCPRCGGKAAIGTIRYEASYAKSEGWDQNEFYYVNCTGFGCGLKNRGMVGKKSPEAAAEHWNHRPIEDALRAELARKGEEIKALDEVVGGEYELRRFYGNLTATLIEITIEAGFKIRGDLAVLCEEQKQMHDWLKTAYAELAAVRGEACPK